MSAMPMSTVFDAMRPAGNVLTDEVIEALRSIFGDRDVSYVTDTPVITLVHEIVTSPEISMFEGIQPVDAVNALLDFMRKLGVIATPEQPATTVKVELPKTLDQMTLSELLTELRDNPNRYVELAPHIEALPEVRKASRKATNWALRNAAGMLDVVATVDYVTHLNKFASLRRDEVGGQRPISLARICGQEERPMLNPFATKQSEVAVTGPFYGDFDLGNLSEERHLAYLWARKHHPDWPKQIDLYEDVPAAFAEELKGRWKKMVDAYNAAKEDGDPTTEGLSRYASADYVSGSRRPFEGESEVEPERTEEWYRGKLEAIATRNCERDGMNPKIKSGVYQRFDISGMNPRCIDIIVLNGGSISGMNPRGSIYALRGARINVDGMNADVDVIEMDAEGLYNKALELGLFNQSGGNTKTSSSKSRPRGEVTFTNYNLGGNSQSFVAETMTFNNGDW